MVTAGVGAASSGVVIGRHFLEMHRRTGAETAC
jgi:hypothetical protein